jgi:hypothetical protein
MKISQVKRVIGNEYNTEQNMQERKKEKQRQ